MKNLARTYDIDTLEGMSGSPAFAMKNKQSQYTCRGLHVSGCCMALKMFREI